MIIGVPAVIAWLAPVLAVAGAVNAFNSTYRTIAYRRLDAAPEPAAWSQVTPPSPA